MIDLALMAAASTLSYGQAIYVADVSAESVLRPFTEASPVVSVSCHRKSKYRFKCYVKAEGERATVSYVVRVVRSADQIIGYGSNLKSN